MEDAEVQAERQELPRSSATRGFGLGVLLPPDPLSRAAGHGKTPARAPRGGRSGPCALCPQRAAVPPTGASAAWGLKTNSWRPLPVPGELETVLRPRPRGDEARGRRGRCRRGSVPRSCRRGRPAARAPVLGPRRSRPRAPPHPRVAAAARARARPPRGRSQGEPPPPPPPLSPRSPAPRAPAPSSDCLLPAALAPASLLRRAYPPASWPIESHQAHGGSRPDPRQPPAPPQPKRPIFAAARGGSPEEKPGVR